MPPFAVLTKSAARDFRLFAINRQHLEARAMKEQVQLPPGGFAMPRLEHDGGLQHGGGRNEPTRIFLDLLVEPASLRLVEKYCQQGRCINHH